MYGKTDCVNQEKRRFVCFRLTVHMYVEQRISYKNRQDNPPTKLCTFYTNYEVA